MPSRPGSTDFQHFKSGWLYLDSYYGSRRFIGEEIVRVIDQTIWGMNYYGAVIRESVDHKIVYGFLKKALQIGVEDGTPFRGPNQWEMETFKYFCAVTGGLKSFSGHEEIYFMGCIVYEATFHGGLVDEIS